MGTWKSSLPVNILIGVVLLAVAFAAGWRTYLTVKAPKQEEYTYVLKCTRCGKIYEGSYPQGKEPPFHCRSCGGPAYPALKCSGCGEIFPSVESPSRRVPYVCRICGKGAFPLKRWEIRFKESSRSP